MSMNLGVPPMTSSFLSSSEAEQLLALPKNTLAKMRVSGEGPAFHKLGKRVRYSMSDLEDWLKARRYSNTSVSQSA
jgi:predicted DNA-binding transcriptional regulator AlpA